MTGNLCSFFASSPFLVRLEVLLFLRHTLCFSLVLCLPCLCHSLSPPPCLPVSFTRRPATEKMTGKKSISLLLVLSLFLFLIFSQAAAARTQVMLAFRLVFISHCGLLQPFRCCRTAQSVWNERREERKKKEGRRHFHVSPRTLLSLETNTGNVNSSQKSTLTAGGG